MFVITRKTEVKSTLTDDSVTFEAKDHLEKAKNKIKGDENWKPQGWGSGEYLETIPKIKAGVVLNLESGDVIWSMNLKDKIAPASLTKVATVITAIDLQALDTQLEVSSQAASQIPTIIGLKAGEKLTLSEAISAAILTSANDATEAIASSIGLMVGNGTADFEEVVNYKLQKIGARQTHFVTSTGLDDPNHYSTVYDLAIIAHEALSNYPFVADVADDTYRRLDANSNHPLFDLPNWNALLGTYPGVNGLKIGFTEDAGHVNIVSAEREGKKLLSIVIGAKSLEEREIAAATLLNYGFSKYNIEPFPIEQLNLVKRYQDWQEQLSLDY